MDFDETERLLKEFEDVPSLPEAEKTFMEIADYPYWERAASNILGFFLSPTNDHGLQDTMLESLLAAAGQHASESELDIENVARETRTESGFLDLVVDTSGLVVGIENKILAPVANPLGEYGEWIKKRAGERRRPVLILLALQRPGPGVNLKGFTPVTYEEFFSQLLREIGPRLPTANDRYVGYLLEFVRTITNLNRRAEVSTAFREFAKKNAENLAKLEAQLEVLAQDMTDRVASLSGKIKLAATSPSYEVTGAVDRKEWSKHLAKGHRFEIVVPTDRYPDKESAAQAIYGKPFNKLIPAHKAWVHMKMTAAKLAVGVYLSPAEWRIIVFQQPDGDIREFLEDKGIQSSPDEWYPNTGHRLCFALSFDADASEVAKKVQLLIDDLRQPQESR